ncbi:MAG: hypothetical protein ACPGU9_04635 [Flavobacteriaceae bacterium]
MSKRLLELGVFTFSDAIEFVKNLPYGRTKHRANFYAVLEELKGTCSTKHAVLRMLATEQGYTTVSLYMCIFKMNGHNTPIVNPILSKYHIDYIPEAHCVLKIDNKFVDVTSSKSNYDNLKADVLCMEEISPEQIGAFKVAYHKKYLKDWMVSQPYPYTFETLWAVREECIRELSEHH